MVSFLEPRGIGKTIARLPGLDTSYAITGAYASAQFAPVTDPVAVDVYVEDIDVYANILELRKSENIGNIRLIRAYDDVAFERITVRNGIRYAAPSQIAADVFGLPKRSESEYLEFIGWMKRNERVWRT